jgi:hypothetical protein
VRKILQLLFNDPNKLHIAGYPRLNLSHKLPILWFSNESMRLLPSIFLGKASNHPQKAAQSIYFYCLRQWRWLSIQIYPKFQKFWLVRNWVCWSHFCQTGGNFFSFKLILRYLKR